MAIPFLMGPHEKIVVDYQRPAEALRDFYLRAHRVIDRAMTAQGASFARARMLMHIAREGPVRSTDLASCFGYAPRTVTEAIDGLERDGLVRRSPAPDDRRAKLITLTATGTAAAAAADASKRRITDRVFGILTAEECGEIERLIGKLNERLADLGG